MIRKKYRIKRKRKYKRKRGRGIFGTVLNLFITLAKLGGSQCNETKKKLRNGKT